jgi:ketosteroid isomerase-like protein
MIGQPAYALGRDGGRKNAPPFAEPGSTSGCGYIMAALCRQINPVAYGAVKEMPQPANDEQRLEDIQQQLARAWTQHDRPFIESVLAPEWSVTQPDGQVLTRAVVLGTFFDAVTFDSNVIDDVNVLMLGDTAVVRGRTVASGTFNGAPVRARIRFTDVFIKREDRWQAVASHASSLSMP